MAFEGDCAFGVRTDLAQSENLEAGELELDGGDLSESSTDARKTKCFKSGSSGSVNILPGRKSPFRIACSSL